ncbi:MAG: restriction endonuclease [Candidatus Bathycorpusculaceae bacterium]
MKLKLTLRDPRAIEIVENIPSDRRDEIIEKYIILGEMVVSHASIGTRKETVEEFFAPLRSDIETIREQLRLIVPIIATPAKKGEITVESIFQSLQEHFMDDSFEDVSRIGKYTDILATTSDTKIPILIELKDYKGMVPSEEVDKFWRDMERRGMRYGIFVSMRSGIAKCSGCINLKTEMNRTAVFVVNSELNWSGHLFAYYVIKKLAELESEKKKELKGEELSKVISKINNHVLDIQKNIETIDGIQKIADNLRTICKNKLDELISLSNTYKTKLNEKIGEIFEEIKKVEL